MARMLHRREDPALGQKVFIAVAAYAGCGAGFTWSLFHTGAALARAGIAYELAIYAGNCHVDDSRNRLTRDFLNSDCTDMVFLDADIGWQAGDFLKLLSYERAIVAGVYPKKHGDDTYPVKLLPGEIWSDADGLIEVMGVPTGFLRIRRAVVERLAETAETYNAKNDRAYATACIFERQIHGGSRWGGDYVFCRKARAAGFKVYVDPTMRFEHSGEDSWSGSLGMWLKARAGIALTAPLAAIRDGRETLEDLIELHEAWGNPFAASVVLLAALARVVRARGSPVLELGSGLSSLVMAAANPSAAIHVVENSPVFAEHLRIEAAKHGLANIHIHCRPLKGGWYDLAEVPAAPWSVVLIDGPSRKEGARKLAFERLNLGEAVVLADDVQRDGGVPELAALLERTHDTQIIEADVRSFAVGVPRKAMRRAA